VWVTTSRATPLVWIGIALAGYHAARQMNAYASESGAAIAAAATHGSAPTVANSIATSAAAGIQIVRYRASRP
jgi:hypothetical protein